MVVVAGRRRAEKTRRRTLRAPRTSPPPELTGFVHPTAIVDPGALVGAGCKIWHFCHVMAGARLGVGVVLGQNVFVGGAVVIGDRCKIANNVSLYDAVMLAEDVFVGPSAVFTNVKTPRAFVSRRGEYLPTRVERGATVGANATVVCGHTLGAYCLVGAGAVVTHDVPAHALVVGAPARRRGWVCICGVTLIEAGRARRGARATFGCPSCARRYTVEGDLVRPARAAPSR
jgi:UDP-2-acetamido-3-amino-2,3-dideoxy-glucuronate N-acetyltransferase